MPWVQKEVVEIVRLNFSKLDIISLKLINQTRGYCQNRIQVICPSTLILVDKGFNQKSLHPQFLINQGPQPEHISCKVEIPETRAVP